MFLSLVGLGLTNSGEFNHCAKLYSFGLRSKAEWTRFNMFSSFLVRALARFEVDFAAINGWLI
jgi:hypothetical protein